MLCDRGPISFWACGYPVFPTPFVEETILKPIFLKASQSTSNQGDTQSCGVSARAKQKFHGLSLQPQTQGPVRQGQEALVPAAGWCVCVWGGVTPLQSGSPHNLGLPGALPELPLTGAQRKLRVSGRWAAKSCGGSPLRPPPASRYEGSLLTCKHTKWVRDDSGRGRAGGGVGMTVTVVRLRGVIMGLALS